MDWDAGDGVDNFVPVSGSSLVWDDSVMTSFRIRFRSGVYASHTGVPFALKIVATDDYGRSAVAVYRMTADPVGEGEQSGEVVFSLEGFSFGCGYFIAPVRVPVYEGVPFSRTLTEILTAHGWTYTYTGSIESGFYLASVGGLNLKNNRIADGIWDFVKDRGYVRSIAEDGTLGEFDFGSGSGWMYSVNGVYKNYGFADYFPQDGDTVRVQFTVMLGEDLGGGGALGGGSSGSLLDDNPDYAPIMKMLANAGQRAITTSIMHKPWAGLSEDHFDSMITRIKKIDGTWAYDYAVFDKWVEFMMNEIGINDMISCYTMIPWALSFDYYDEATNRVQFLNTKPGDAAYADYWGTFLKDFSRHLREKGWFEKTAISMDERPMEAMREAIKVIKQADPEFKITLAGNYHPEIQSDLYYLSIPYGHKFPEDVKAARDKAGQISTVYTCCAEAFPNTFTFSDPAEAAWTVLHAVAGGYDGYLRWAVNSWTADPLRDSRFRTWAAGDTYSIYPGPRSSIRFERLVEGIQDCEKIRILREELTTKGAKGKLEKLNKTVAKITPEGLSETQESATQMVNEIHKLLNTL